MPRRTPFIVPPTPSESDYRRGRPQRRRARCPAAVRARLSGNHRARRRVFGGAIKWTDDRLQQSAAPSRPATPKARPVTWPNAWYRPAGCRPKPRGDRQSAAQGLAGITAVKRSRYPRLSRAVHMADAPIELLRLQMLVDSAPPRLRADGFEPPPCVLRVPLCVLSTLLRVVYFSASAHRPSRPASRGRRRRLLSRGSAA
jgi:hypothetical protein